jgi:hypothetical protein
VIRTCQAHLAYRYHVGALPQDAVPVLRFCAAMAAGQEMAITDPAGNIIVISSGPFGPATWPERYIQCAETLAEVQQLTGTAFPLPAALPQRTSGTCTTPARSCVAKTSRRSGAA